MSGAEAVANNDFNALTSGYDFTLPIIDMADPRFNFPPIGETAEAVPALTNDSFTSRVVDGTGTFDWMMAGVKAQLDGEFKSGRITGAEYTKAYIALTQSVMAASVQFLLGRDAAFWASVQAQILSTTALVGLETAKLTMLEARGQALVAEATFALTKMKIATESATYDQAAFATNVVGPEQVLLIREQKESARAQTMDTRSDGATVVGAVGKQKDLYAQQITSYKRDAETKVAKIFSDAWITQKTLDEGLLPPNSFTNASIDAIMGELKTNLGL